MRKHRDNNYNYTSSLTFQQQEKSHLEKVVVNGVIRSGFLVPKACEVLCVKFYGRIFCSQNEVDLSSLKTLLSLLT